VKRPALLVARARLHTHDREFMKFFQVGSAGIRTAATQAGDDGIKKILHARALPI
jgi:hypothetical protein